MEIKTIWQPVPPWPVKTKLMRSKYPVHNRLPKVFAEVKNTAPTLYKALGYRRSNEMRKWIVEDNDV
jgi:hypothetical protein